MQIALTRQLGQALAACQLSFVERSPIDVALAENQHAQYCRALSSLGCKVVVLPALAGHPDAVFVEDTALVFDELAVLTRPGASTRRGEVDSVAEALSAYRSLARIESPGTIDGGDVLRLGRKVFVGRSARSSDQGIAQLSALIAAHGYSVLGVRTRDCLHLKSAVTAVSPDTLLVNPDWVDPGNWPDWKLIEVDPSEPHAANALLAGAGLVYPAGFPRTEARLRAAGIDPSIVDLSELQKAEGATTCCCLVINQPG